MITLRFLLLFKGSLRLSGSYGSIVLCIDNNKDIKHFRRFGDFEVQKELK